jgi:hypothetical protein
MRPHPDDVLEVGRHSVEEPFVEVVHNMNMKSTPLPTPSFVDCASVMVKQVAVAISHDEVQHTVGVGDDCAVDMNVRVVVDGDYCMKETY